MSDIQNSLLVKVRKLKKTPSEYKIFKKSSHRNPNDEIRTINDIHTMIKQLNYNKGYSPFNSKLQNNKTRRKLNHLSFNKTTAQTSFFNDSFKNNPSKESKSPQCKINLDYIKKTKSKKANFNHFLSFDGNSNDNHIYAYDHTLTENIMIKRHLMKKNSLILRFKQIQDTNCALIDNARQRLKKTFKSLKISLQINKKKTTNPKEIFSMEREDDFKRYLIDQYLNTLNELSSSVPSSNKRRIFVIQHSAVIINPYIIPGLILEIPSYNTLSKCPIENTPKMLKGFLIYCEKAFNIVNHFSHVFNSNYREIYSLNDIKGDDRYIYVTMTPFFNGIALPINTNIIQLYKEHYVNFAKGYIEENNSSDSDDDNNDNKPDETSEYFYKKNIVYDIFFKNKRKKPFIRTSISKKDQSHRDITTRNHSFTDGYDDLIPKEDFLFCSDNEESKKKGRKELKTFLIKRVDFFIKSNNDLCDTKIKLLKQKLKSKSTEKDNHKTKSQLIDHYLIKNKLQKKYLSPNLTSSQLTPDHILDSAKVLKQNDPSFNINTFILRKGNTDHRPIIAKNILDIKGHIRGNEQKVKKEYQHLLNYNIPSIIESYPQYKRKDLYALFTQFKALLNIWYSRNNGVNVVQSGIDFNVFHTCINGYCEEEKVLVKKVFDELNKGPDGMLLLHRFIEGMMKLTRSDLKDQLCFLLESFDTKNKGEFDYKEMLEIAKMSLRRLSKNAEARNEDNPVTIDLANFFVKYIYSLVNIDHKKSIQLAKLKECIETKPNEMKYLEVFCCSLKQ